MRNDPAAARGAAHVSRSRAVSRTTLAPKVHFPTRDISPAHTHTHNTHTHTQRYEKAQGINRVIYSNYFERII